MQNYIGLHKSRLNTPVLLIDKNKLLTNIQSMQDFALSKNIALRPHAKTHKCSKIAKLQLDKGAIGICVTKVSEAEQLAKEGINGILITSPIVTQNKIQTLINILKIAPDTMVVIDNIANAKQLNVILQQNKLKLSILLDIDGGNARTGVSFADAIKTAKIINQLSNLSFKGIQCYSGHIQHIENINKRKLASNEILCQAGKIKQRLIDLGIDCQIQSGSGTGTFSFDVDIPMITEIQPGSYTVMDQEYLEIEIDTVKFLPAMTMLSTVISTNHKTHVTIDAGIKAMYKVETVPKVINPQNLIYDWGGFGDEHAKLIPQGEAKLPMLGEIVELIVAHCDPTINLFDKFYITENDIVIDCWDIDLRGKCQ